MQDECNIMIPAVIERIEFTINGFYGAEQNITVYG